ncbi:DNA mismatch repair protein MutL [Thermaurantimonas aggregans]|uniref:DNA mismatch repair protein MutL n=1 Tax=Thermaurantimonas aggregans TaxID=2173829 RepID=A0A401XNN7_9FLAO|nr:DNA mismatch repair endonuclease MutL [Thermaurantimonas aggregans]MCX8147683.1 DNA mismatch repair endonuclease MutL [Thermaurantimonas aggregans]GCD78631.1 DNA mismatch repair protein MutL [Thermaurantimonas aggregans]
MSTSVIKLLPDHIANQIAAGEVVQRPASVVKELLENSVDAGAIQITLLIEDAGKSLIKVIDNGCGISETDIRLAFERHATSKIRKAEDLFAITTMGFRGEALASIAAVSQVECVSKTPDSSTGTRLVIEGGKVKEQLPEASMTGTSIAVKNLFFNIPARRNFLKSDSVELRHIYEEFIRIALAHPDKRLKLVNNGTEIYNLLPGTHKQRIISIFGNKMADNLLQIREQTTVITISGFLTMPSVAKKIKGEQYFFINKRFVKNSYLHHAIMAAYEGLLQPETYPSYFVFIDIDPAEIDVNIHPTKTEIKFRDDRTVYHLLKAAARKTLGINAVSQPMDFDVERSIHIPFDETKTPKIPTIEVHPDYNPFTNPAPQGRSVEKIQVPTVNIPKNWEELYKIAALTKADVQNSDPPENDLIALTQQIEVSLHEETEIFQLFKKYIVYKRGSQVFIIHQQYAHERVLYENFQKSIRNRSILSQQMLIPVKIEFTPHEIEYLSKIKHLLSDFGFDFEWIGRNEIALYGMPVDLQIEHAEEIFKNLCQNLTEYSDAEEVINDVLCRQIAFVSAYRSGQILHQEAMARLVNELFKLENPAAGIRRKKTFIQLQSTDIDKWFN